MITFKEYITEAESITPVSTGVISVQELLKHISKAKLDSIAKHPWFRQYMGVAQSSGVSVGYRYRLERTGFEYVDVAHGPMGDEALRRMLTFRLRYKGRAVSQVELYQNWNNERFTFEPKNIKWSHVKSLNN
jgi:hypothetical protein